MQEECKKLYYFELGKLLRTRIFYAYGTDGEISLYMGHIDERIDDWFGEEEKEDDDDDHDSCVVGGERERHC